MLPCYDDIRLPLLAELQCRGGLSRPRDKNEKGQTIYSALANYFSLSQVDLNQKVMKKTALLDPNGKTWFGGHATTSKNSNFLLLRTTAYGLLAIKVYPC